MTLSVYLASTYARMDEIAGYARRLRSAGIKVTSAWHDGEHAADDGNRAMWPTFGGDDLDGIDAAEVVVVFTGQQSTRGGYHDEAGYAVGSLKYVLLVGPIDNCIQAAWISQQRAFAVDDFDAAFQMLFDHAWPTRAFHRRCVFSAIDAERVRQERKHAGHTVADRHVTTLDKLGILTEEYVEMQAEHARVFEAFVKAVVDSERVPFSEKSAAMRRVEVELLQVAAVSVAWLESFEATR